MKKSLIIPVLGASGLLLASALNADTFTATSGISDWNDPAQWGAPQMAGNDFVFAPASDANLKTQSESFDGASLTMHGGTLLPVSPMTQDIIFADDCRIVSNNHHGRYAGNWTISDLTVLNARRPSTNLDAVLLGEGLFYIQSGPSGSVKLSASTLANFEGALIVGHPNGGVVTNVSILGDVNASTVELQLDLREIDGVVDYSTLALDHSFTFSKVILGGVEMEPGIYSFSDLTAEQQNYFIDNGGELVVAPADLPTGTLIEVSLHEVTKPDSAS